MEISTYSCLLDDVLCGPNTEAQRAFILLDRYAALNSDDAKDAFVSALVHRVLTEHARRLAYTR